VGARFSAPVQTGPEAHPASCTMGNRVFPGGKLRPGRDADPSPLSSAEVKNRVELYLYSPQGPSYPMKGWNLPTYVLLSYITLVSTANSYVTYRICRSL